jgi:hypothetical protein
MKHQQTDGSAAEGENGEIIVKQDSYRNVVFGQIADGLIPTHPGPPEADYDELTDAAINDPAAKELDAQDEHPTIWRALFLAALVIVVLAVVFWKNWYRAGA